MRTMIALAMLAMFASVHVAQEAPPAPAATAESALAALKPLVGPMGDRAAAFEKPKPTEAEYGMVFEGDAAKTASATYAKQLWTSAAQVSASFFPEGRDEVEGWLATGQEVKEWKGAARTHFSWGMRRIAHHFKSDVAWFAFRSFQKGGPRGQIFTGLCWVNSRWVMMPLPWALMPDLCKDYEDDFQPAKDSPSVTHKGTEEGARALLALFVKPEADWNALTSALRPRKMDIEAIWTEPAAAHYAKTYIAQFDNGLTVGTKPGQTEVICNFMNTDDVIAWTDEAYKILPGGYQKVKQWLKPGLPIVRFKFVEKGETLGMAYDGLYYVNERWVLMSNPWRNMPQEGK